MSKPTSPYQFATDANMSDPAQDWDGTPTKVDPGSSRRAAGFLPARIVPADWVNFLLNAIGNWIGWLSGRFEDGGAVLLEANYSPALGAGGGGLGSGNIERVVNLAAGVALGGTSPQWEFVSDSGSFTWRTLSNSGVLVIPICEALNQASLDGGSTANGTLKIVSVSVFLKPGAGRTGTDRTLVALQSQTVSGGAPTTLSTLASQFCTASSTSNETVTATPGSPVTVDSLTDLFVQVTGGNDAGSNKDKVYRVLIQYTRTRTPL